MNIFAGTEPPAWLSDLRRENSEMFGRLGDMLGTTASAGMLAMTQRDTSKPVNPETGKQPHISFSQAWQEARLNQTDPFWKLKKAQAEANITGEIARAEAANALAQARAQENAAIAEDIPNLAKFMQDPNQPSPPIKSQFGAELMHKTLYSSGANRIAANGAKAWTTMLNNLTNKGGMHAVVAGRYAQYLDQVPPTQVMEQFGKDIAQLGLTEKELAESAGPVTSITQGTRGMVVKREQPLIDAKANAAMAVNENQGAINSERDAAKFGQQKDLQNLKGEQQTQLLDKRIQGQESLQNLKGEQAKGMEQMKQQGRESLAKMKAETAKAVADVKGQPSYYSARAKILAKSLEIAQQESIDNPDDEDAKSTLLDLERQFLDLYTKQRKQPTGSGSGFTPAGQAQKIGRFTVTPGK